MSSKNRDAAEQSFLLDMTPMIDCTFNLLIFFLCNINFKLLEGKIPAFLPKDVGVNPMQLDATLEKVEIRVHRAAAPDVRDPNWKWDERQLRIVVQDHSCSGLEELHDLLKRVHEAHPETKATLYAGKGTLYVDNVKVLNECLRARLTDITFAGVPLDA